jgi:hypothetical protein
MLQNARNLKETLQKGTRQIKDIITEKTKERRQGRIMHGQFPRSLDEKLVGNEQSYRWLKFRNIKGERESTIVAAQDHAISINYFKYKILKKRN